MRGFNRASVVLNFVLEISARHGHELLPPGLAVGAVAMLASTTVFVAVSMATPKQQLAADIDALLDA